MKARKFMFFMLVLVAIGMLPIQSQAVILTADKDLFIASIPYAAPVTIGLPEGSTLNAGDDIALPCGGQSLSFDIDMTVYKVGSGWSTWSGGYTGKVLYTQGLTEVTGTFSGGIPGFGMEIEPNPYNIYNITVELDNGQLLTQAVNGNGGAKFWGYYGHGAFNILSFTITSDVDFAVGNFLEAACCPPQAPIPGTMLMLGSALLGLVGLRTRK